MGRTGDGNSRTDLGLSPDSSLLTDKRTPVDRAKHETLIGSILRKKDPTILASFTGISLAKVCEINAMAEGFTFT
jgi:hypothetical protein